MHIFKAWLAFRTCLVFPGYSKDVRNSIKEKVETKISGHEHRTLKL